ncbi:MAG: hypothetical protein IJX38_02140 [Clostridia bacterium]|nr:hypothetical protein [Clostridia bacterium]MBQ8371728.1 hypothetical protein [Clostridia bacterium]
MDGKRRECSICRGMTSDNPVILAVTPFGSKRYMCDECARLAKRASLGTDYDDIVEAMGALSLRLARFNIGDVATVDAVGSLIDRASKRASAIKDGTYDFALDHVDEQESATAETEKGAAVDKQNSTERAEKPRGSERMINIASIGILAAALVGCLIYIIFFS